jgi:hypothetical protein
MVQKTHTASRISTHRDHRLADDNAKRKFLRLWPQPYKRVVGALRQDWRDGPNRDTMSRVGKGMEPMWMSTSLAVKNPCFERRGASLPETWAWWWGDRPWMWGSRSLTHIQGGLPPSAEGNSLVAHACGFGLDVAESQERSCRQVWQYPAASTSEPNEPVIRKTIGRDLGIGVRSKRPSCVAASANSATTSPCVSASGRVVTPVQLQWCLS